MGRYYSVQFTAVALTAAADLFELTIATDRPIRIWGWNIFQTTDLGDTSEEVLDLTLQRAVTAGSGGSSVTPVALNDRDASAGTTCNRTVTTAHTSGTVLLRRGWNVRIPEEYWFTPETAPKIDTAADPVTLTLTAPADPITVSGSLIFEEV